MPLAVMAPPKHMAHIINQMVFIIPAMPRVETKEFNISFPVSSCVDPYNVMNAPLNIEAALMLSAPAICCNRLGWNNRAKTAASSADINRVMSGATRLAISMPVTTGTIIRTAEMWKVSFNDAAKLMAWLALA